MVLARATRLTLNPGGAMMVVMILKSCRNIGRECPFRREENRPSTQDTENLKLR
jgi:hypothetical protein